MLVKKLKAGALDGRKWVYSYSPVMDITGQTNLSFLHTHYFMRGMFFFLILLLLNIKKRAACLEIRLKHKKELTDPLRISQLFF